MNCLKSPVSRIGGKYYLTGWITQYIPEHVCYVEPFAGGAKLLFVKEHSPVEILNDIDNNLVNLYRIIQNDEKRQKLIKLLNETPYSRSVFQSLKHSEPENEIEKAVRYFYLCRTSFAGDVERGGFGAPSKGTGRNPARTFRTAIDSLDIIANRLKNAVIECLDFGDCISKYDSETTLFYCDAPYLTDNSRRYYSQEFTYTDHIKLASLLNSIKGMVMFCHYEHDEIDKLYAGWNRYEYKSFKGSHKSNGESKPVTVECLYTNFEPQIKTQGLFNGVV